MKDSTIMKDLLECCIAVELVESYLFYGAPNTLHEAYAVLLEELQEAHEAFVIYHNLVSDDNLDIIFKACREQYENDPLVIVKDIEEAAFNTAAELVQVCAMCRKFISKAIDERQTNNESCVPKAAMQ